MTRWEEQSIEFKKILDEIFEVHQRKGSDYSTGHDDHYSNVRQSSEFGIEPWLGAIIRQNDKIGRIKSFVKNKKLYNESVEDSLLDNATYALIALALYREDSKCS